MGVGAAVVLVIVAAAISVVIGVVRGAAATEEPVAAVISEAAMPAIYVHVFGAVVEPGLYRLDDGARVVDIVAAAGGLTDNADESAINLARVLADGEQLYVPVIGEVAPPAVEAHGSAGGLVNLNSADVSALDGLPRIGPAIADRIIEWRETNGPFTSVDDLLAVPGIGEKMLAALRDLVTV